jgi:aryl-alcohol dehydrogenase-like predicted oxidoreductase
VITKIINPRNHMHAIERRELSPGYEISRLLKGGWHLSSGHNASVERQKAIDDMAAFVEAGFTSFDCADHYLGVEQMIGDFRRSYPELGSRIQIHTKYVPDLDQLATLSTADTTSIIERSLRRLGVDCLDLVQFFWWDSTIPGADKTMETLGQLQQAGKIRHIGVTNFSVAQLQPLVATGVPILVHQLQYSLVDRRLERGMREYCRANGIHVLTYGHLLGGFMSESWLGQPEPDEPYANRSLRKYKLIIEDFGGWALFQELLAILVKVGQRHGVGPGEVALRWTLDQDLVAGCIVGATSTRYLQRNTAVFGFALDTVDLVELDAVCRRRSGPPGDIYELENDRQGKHGRIMRQNQNQMEDQPWPPTAK